MPFTIWTWELHVLTCNSFEELKKLPKIYDLEDLLIEYDTQGRLKIYWISDDPTIKGEQTYLIN